MKRVFLPKQADSLSVAEFRKELAQQIQRAQSGRNIIVTSHGKPKVVLISYAEYAALTESQPQNEKTLDYNKWSKEAPQRKKITQSISALFDTNQLDRKGQKGYKESAVKKFNKSPKTTQKSRQPKKS